MEKRGSFLFFIFLLFFLQGNAQKSFYSLIIDDKCIIKVEDLTPSSPKDFPFEISFTSEKVFGEKGLLVKTQKGGGFVSLTTPYIQVKPQTDYSVIVNFYALKSTSEEKVQLLIREFEVNETKPIQPYIKTSQQSIMKQKEWFIENRTFKTGEKTDRINLSIVISGTNPFEVIVGGVIFETKKKITWKDFENKLKELQEEASKRKQISERTFVFTRTQAKYGIERNYMGRWTDRPLHLDKLLRNTKYVLNPYESFLKDMKMIKDIYDLDGFAFFPETKDRTILYDYVEKADIKDFKLLTEFLPSQNIEEKGKILERAKNCPFSFRINDKIVITSYNAHSLTPKQWDNILEELRSKNVADFVFLPALSLGVRFIQDFQKRIPIDEIDINKEKENLKAYANICDGLYYHWPAAFKTIERTFDREYYEKFFIPIYKSILSQPEYKNKYFGLSGVLSHSNPSLSIGIEEDNTKTLRYSFEAAMEAKPDVIVLPEWDEQNENTCIRPTVYNSFSTGRILRYYMSKIKGKEPTPIPGDDLNIPNLIISYRKIIVLGEKLKIELLNVPDASISEKYKVILILKDEKGNTVDKFEPVEFTTSILSDKTYIIPSEKYSKYRVLVPSLVIQNYKGKNLTFENGFHHINLRGTWTWDFKYVKQPLRDLINPAECIFKMKEYDEKTGIMTVEGSFSCNEPIAFVEVLEDDSVVYAVDDKDEYFRNNPDYALFRIEYRSLFYGDKTKYLDGKIRIVDGKNIKWFKQEEGDGFVEAKDEITSENVFKLNTPVSSHTRAIFFAIPEKTFDSCILDFDFNLLKTQIPLKKIIEKEIYSIELNGIILTVSKYYKQPDIPYHLDRNSCWFVAKIKPEIPTSIIHTRIITKSGKTFRSLPLIVPIKNTEIAKLRIYSDFYEKPIDIDIEKFRVPELNYEFSDQRGTIFYTPYGRPFWAQLGGFIDSSTGIGATGGHAESLYAHLNGQNYPEKFKTYSPNWEIKDGRKVLYFDGYGNFITLPRETIPRHSSFKISFEIMPVHSKDQYLLVVGRYKEFSIYIEDGKLKGRFIAKGTIYDFDTNLEIPPGKWSKIEIKYDFEKMEFDVNGRKFVKECKGVLRDMGAVGFGGFGKTEIDDKYGGNKWWFEGYLRSLKIIHNSN
ncbi:MAG: LamG domain-containing protein [Candidatus Omnitrophica bacterium]|nr:LamG domain-containing protein [Candidatus Omnitrophota bacterium]